MISFSKLVIVFGLLAALALQANAALMPSMCSVQEEETTPCVCCKKGCWFGIAEMTTNYFGHMPGERSDAESRFALAMMSQCFKLECSEVCSTSR